MIGTLKYNGSIVVWTIVYKSEIIISNFHDFGNITVEFHFYHLFKHINFFLKYILKGSAILTPIPYKILFTKHVISPSCIKTFR